MILPTIHKYITSTSLVPSDALNDEDMLISLYYNHNMFVTVQYHIHLLFTRQIYSMNFIDFVDIYENVVVNFNVL